MKNFKIQRWISCAGSIFNKKPSSTTVHFCPRRLYDANYTMAFCCFTLLLGLSTKARSLLVSPRSFPRPVPQLPVVVVGGGLAGLAASIEASRAGAPVILMEKGNRIGGNSAKATSGRHLHTRARARYFCQQTPS